MLKLLMMAVRYDLHVLLVGHGKRCPRCAANGRPRFAPDGPCPLFPSKGLASKCACIGAASLACRACVALLQAPTLTLTCDVHSLSNSYCFRRSTASKGVERPTDDLVPAEMMRCDLELDRPLNWKPSLKPTEGLSSQQDSAEAAPLKVHPQWQKSAQNCVGCNPILNSDGCLDAGST